MTSKINQYIEELKNKIERSRVRGDWKADTEFMILEEKIQTAQDILKMVREEIEEINEIANNRFDFYNEFLEKLPKEEKTNE